MSHNTSGASAKSQVSTEDDEMQDVVSKIKTHLYIGSQAAQSRYRYDMNHPRRGDLLVINNKSFRNLPDRPGADVDTQSIRDCFQPMGFNVVQYANQTCTDMRRLVKEAAERDHTDADCFCCIVLSHGEGDQLIHGTDSSMTLDQLFSPFKECASLVEKPKIFIIQACRGEEMDQGHTIQSDASRWGRAKEYKIPIEADFLYIYSSVPGYRSFRNKKVGSYFIRALCNMLEYYRSSRDVLWILTRVNHSLAYDFLSHSKAAECDQKKQVSSFVSMLTKALYLAREKELQLQ